MSISSQYILFHKPKGKHGRLVIVNLLLKYLYLNYNNRSLQLWHVVWLYPRFIGPTLQRWSLLLDHSYQTPPLFLVQISDTLNYTIWIKLNWFFYQIVTEIHLDLFCLSFSRSMKIKTNLFIFQHKHKRKGKYVYLSAWT